MQTVLVIGATGQSQPEWLTDDEVGAHVARIVESPDEFADTILTLQQRDKA